MKRILAVVTTLVLACVGAPAETAWHYFSARLYSGVVENGGIINSRPGYEELDMGSDAIYGIAFDMFLAENFGLKFDLSQFSNTATQYGTEEYGGDSINFDLEVTSFSVTGKRRFNFWDGLIVPWVGAGVDLSMIRTYEREYVATASGPYKEDEREEVSNGLGIHGSLGLDLYPVQASSLALMVETRYTLYSTSSPFDGDVNGAMFLIGLKWDFEQRPF